MIQEEAVETVRALLGGAIRYYREAALKPKGQSEVSRALKTLGKKCRRDLDKLPGQEL